MASLVPVWLRVLRAISLLSAIALMGVTVSIVIAAERERAAADVERSLHFTAESQRQALENYFTRARP